MAGYKTEQRYLSHRGAEYHFVSYEGQAANPKKARLATAPMWFLMKAGKRWAVMDQVSGQPLEEVDQQLISWLEEQHFPRVPTTVAVDAGNTSRWDNRWTEKRPARA